MFKALSSTSILAAALIACGSSSNNGDEDANGGSGSSSDNGSDSGSDNGSGSGSDTATCVFESTTTITIPAGDTHATFTPESGSGSAYHPNEIQFVGTFQNDAQLNIAVVSSTEQSDVPTPDFPQLGAGMANLASARDASAALVHFIPTGSDTVMVDKVYLATAGELTLTAMGSANGTFAGSLNAQFKDWQFIIEGTSIVFGINAVDSCTTTVSAASFTATEMVMDGTDVVPSPRTRRAVSIQPSISEVP